MTDKHTPGPYTIRRSKLHVDGAYGAAAVFCEQGKALLDGLARVDSLSLDPHKWLFQPYEIGCVLVREERWLKETFHILPEYLEDIEGFGVGTEANIVYSGQFMMAHVRHIEPQADVGYIVGVVCELIE